MATPHIAGLTAYLLSLYGSPSFNPSLIDPTLDASAFSAQTPLLQKAMSLLPSYVAAFIPQIIRSAVVAPTPKVPTLTPAKLKKAILALATVDALSGELPAGTPNLSVFGFFSSLPFLPELTLSRSSFVQVGLQQLHPQGLKRLVRFPPSPISQRTEPTSRHLGFPQTSLLDSFTS